MKNFRGQVVVEYVLLLVFVVSIALILINFVGVWQTSPEEGQLSLKNYWYEVIRRIGEDN